MVHVEVVIHIVECLPNGHILLTQSSAVTEFELDGSQVWTFECKSPTSVRRLPTGNTLVVRKTAGTSTGNILIVDTKGLVYDASNRQLVAQNWNWVCDRIN